MPTLNEVITDIRTNHKQVSASSRDEVRVMQAMLNDTSYEVGVYGKEGKVDTYNPAKDFRAMQANIVASVAKISKAESEQLVNGYELTKSDASTMVGVSKEFVNTYIGTGRKLPLGGREMSDYSLVGKEIPETVKVFNIRRKDSNGNETWDKGQKVVPAHLGLKAKSPCPDWVK